MTAGLDMEPAVAPCKEREIEAAKARAGAVVVPATRTSIPRRDRASSRCRGHASRFPEQVAAGAGTTRIDPSTGKLAGDTIRDQTRQALTNCKGVLEPGGADLDDVIEVGVLLTHPADFARLNEEHAQWFRSDPPTRWVAKLGVDLPGPLVSIRITAFVA